MIQILILLRGYQNMIPVLIYGASEQEKNCLQGYSIIVQGVINLS